MVMALALMACDVTANDEPAEAAHTAAETCAADAPVIVVSWTASGSGSAEAPAIGTVRDFLVCDPSGAPLDGELRVYADGREVVVLWTSRSWSRVDGIWWPVSSTLRVESADPVVELLVQARF